MFLDSLALLVLSIVPGILLDLYYWRDARQASARGDEEFFDGVDAGFRGFVYVVGHIALTAVAAIVAQRVILHTDFPWWADLGLWAIALGIVVAIFIMILAHYDNKCGVVAGQYWD